MAKLKIYRQSGSPVAPDMQQKYDEEFKAAFDKCELKADKVFQKNVGYLTKVPRMIVMQRLLRYAERSLVKKYNGQAEVELPKSAKAWSALLSKFGDTPLLVAKSADGEALVLILMDTLE